MNCSDEFDKELEVVDEIYNDTNDENKLEDDSITADISEVENYADFVEDLNAVATNSSRFDIVELEESIEDKEESVMVESMYGENSPPCCSKKCNKIISENIVIESRRFFQEMSKADQDLVYLSHLQFHRQDLSMEAIYDSQTRKKYGKRAESDKSRIDTVYLFRGVYVCKKMFTFIYNIGNKRYKNLIQHFENVGFCERKHGLSGKPSKRKSRVLSVESVTRIVEFIKNFAEKFAIPLPGRMPNFRDYKVMKLPSSETKSAVYRRFVKVCLPEDEIALKTFLKIWAHYCPYISPMKPATDLCDVCQQNAVIVQRALTEMSTEAREEKLQVALAHLERAKGQRQFYQQCCKVIDSNEPATSTLTLSYDYAQNVSYPSRPQQTGSSYFKAARKCSLFGIHNEITKVQTNYLLDEEFEIGKGPNAVISQIHHYFETNPAENLVLFCDNCVAQNKNNCMLHYLSWRVDSGKNKSITLNFLLTGHTKFSPDRSFGLIKLEYGRSNVDCYQDFEEVVNRSSHKKFNVAVNGSTIQWRTWDAHFKEFYRTLPGKFS